MHEENLIEVRNLKKYFPIKKDYSAEKQSN